MVGVIFWTVKVTTGLKAASHDGLETKLKKMTALTEILGHWSDSGSENALFSS